MRARARRGERDPRSRWSARARGGERGRAPRASPKSRRRATSARCAESRSTNARARAANALAVSVERKLRAIEADAPERERFEKCITETACAKREAETARARLDATRAEHALSTREEVAARASLEKALFGARESLGTARLETEAVRFELTKWQAAVHERDAALDAMSVTRRDAEAALEASRVDALEARRAAAVAEGRARAAVEAEKARRHTGALSGGESRTVANDLDSRELGGFENGGGEYTVTHPASPARRETRRQPRPGLGRPGLPRRRLRAVASAPRRLARAARPNRVGIDREKRGRARGVHAHGAARGVVTRLRRERGRGEVFFFFFCE